PAGIVPRHDPDILESATDERPGKHETLFFVKVVFALAQDHVPRVMMFAGIKRPAIVAVVVVKVHDDLFLGSEFEEFLRHVNFAENVELLSRSEEHTSELQSRENLV